MTGFDEREFERWMNAGDPELRVAQAQLQMIHTFMSALVAGLGMEEPAEDEWEDSGEAAQAVLDLCTPEEPTRSDGKASKDMLRATRISALATWRLMSTAIEVLESNLDPTSEPPDYFGV